MKVYEGDRTPTGTTVMVFDGSLTAPIYPLPPRADLRNHSPDGFEWGYAGSGPSQLALALCADVLGNDERAVSVYMDFKSKVIVPILMDHWMMTEDAIREHIVTLETGLRLARAT